MIRFLLVVCSAFVIATVAVAIDQDRAFEDPVLQARYERLNGYINGQHG